MVDITAFIMDYKYVNGKETWEYDTDAMLVKAKKFNEELKKRYGIKGKIEKVKSRNSGRYISIVLEDVDDKKMGPIFTMLKKTAKPFSINIKWRNKES